RLVKSLRDERQLVTFVSAYSYTPSYPYGFLGVSFFSMATTAMEALKGVVQEIIRLAEVPPNTEELKRVVNALRLQRIYERESMDGIARSAGMSLLTSKKLRFDEEYMLRVSKITTDDIQTIALQVLNKLTNGLFAISSVLDKEGLVHLTEEKLKQEIVAVAQISSPLQNTKTFSHSQDKIFQHHTSHINEDVKQIVISLPRGKTLHINYRENDRLPIVSGMLVFKGGLTYEPQGKNGVGSLCASLLTRGTKNQSYRKFVEELEDHCASITSFSSRDIFGLRFDALTEKSPRVLQMMLDALFRPEFSHEEWLKNYKETQEVLVAQKDSPTNKLSRMTQALLFKEHPYSNLNLGTLDSLKNISLDDVKNFWSALFAADTYVFSAAGHLPLNALVHLLETEFQLYLSQATISPPTLEKPGAPCALLNADERARVVYFEREQAHVSLACRAFPIGDERRIPLEVACAILAGQGGRLFLDLRDKQSLAYSVSASQSSHLLSGSFSAYIGTSPQNVEQAVLGLKRHLERLAKEPPSAEELTRAKNSLIGSQSIESQHFSFQASQLAMSDVYGLGFDNFLRFAKRVENVTAEQVSQVLSQVLSENQPILAIVGPKEMMKEGEGQEAGIEKLFKQDSHEFLSWHT
ncbi:MAG: insulinase family protein, partial [Silvanigrellaceae bacterium]|nr:insulinase family protein [Silvanigrellaceae bacterium]